jgi:mannose-6-phosphate isomerase-like protein (cupin superfamily)
MTTDVAVAGVVRDGDGRTLLDGPLGAVLLAGAEQTRGTIAFLIHPLAPRALGSPVHTHTHEDEWSYVLEGEMGVEVDGRTSLARAGDLVLKPRGVPHAFWNAGDAPARILEVVTPAGFERYFERLGELLAVPGPPDLLALQEVAAPPGLDVDPASVARLAQAHGLRIG